MDSQTKQLNQCLEMYLPCMANQQPKILAKWLVPAELWYSTSYHMNLKMTLFQTLYRYPPPHFSESVELYSISPQYIDNHKSERSFEVQDWVLLKLQPFKQGLGEKGRA